MKGPVETTRYELYLEMPPDDVLAALVDFGPDRPSIWRETSHASVYRVHHLGESQAEVTEGVPFAWSRELYDWSIPGIVTLTQLDSNVARSGTIRYEIRADGSGSHVICERRREFFGARGRVAGTFMVLAGERILSHQLRAGFARWGLTPAG